MEGNESHLAAVTVLVTIIMLCYLFTPLLDPSLFSSNSLSVVLYLNYARSFGIALFVRSWTLRFLSKTRDPPAPCSSSSVPITASRLLPSLSRAFETFLRVLLGALPPSLHWVVGLCVHRTAMPVAVRNYRSVLCRVYLCMSVSLMGTSWNRT